MSRFNNKKANVAWKRPRSLHELRKNFRKKSSSSNDVPESIMNGGCDKEEEEEENLIERQLDEIWGNYGT